MKQKVIKIGSSIGVVIPKSTAEELGFRAGQEVTLRPNAAARQIVIERATAGQKGNSKLVAWAEDAVERYRPALEALKNK